VNPEETCKMIDTIHDGNRYDYEIPGQLDSIIFGDTVVCFGLHDSIDVRNPRQAREIAAALVAWADHKEGRNTPSEIADFLPATNPVIVTGLAKSHPEV
jgi:hypothetical protein